MVKAKIQSVEPMVADLVVSVPRNCLTKLKTYQQKRLIITIYLV